MFPSLLSAGEEITVQVYAVHKINKNRKPHTIEIDSFVISVVATAPEFRFIVLQQNCLRGLGQKINVFLILTIVLHDFLNMSLLLSCSKHEGKIHIGLTDAE